MCEKQGDTEYKKPKAGNWLVLSRKDESLVGLKSEQKEEWPEMKEPQGPGLRSLSLLLREATDSLKQGHTNPRRPEPG